MKNLICIVCGEEAWKKNLCKKHFAEKLKLINIKDFSLAVCRNCGSYYDGKWNKTENMEKLLIDTVKRNVGRNAKIDSRKIGNRMRLRISATAKIAGAEKSEKKILNVFLKKRLCENCVKLSGGYYEAMLQIRGGNSEKIFEKIEKADVSAVASVQKVRNGYDIKLLKKDTARKLVRLLRGREIKKSYKHVTTKKGRLIYRDYYSIR